MGDMRVRGERLTREERLVVRQLISGGCSFEDAARAVRCSTKTVHRLLNAVGGLPPQAPEGSSAARDYAHYYLGPLIMLALDGLLAEKGTAVSVRMLTRDIHAGNSPGLLASLRRVLPRRFGQIRSWMDGTEAIPAGLVETGLARLQDRVVEIAQ